MNESVTLTHTAENEKMICPICGRIYSKWQWRTDCCGAEIVWIEKR